MVQQDMTMQMRWVKLMRPVKSLLKFRLPWDDKITHYLSLFSPFLLSNQSSLCHHFQRARRICQRSGLRQPQKLGWSAAGKRKQTTTTSGITSKCISTTRWCAARVFLICLRTTSTRSPRKDWITASTACRKFGFSMRTWKSMAFRTLSLCLLDGARTWMLTSWIKPARLLRFPFACLTSLFMLAGADCMRCSSP